jgi:lysozyme
MRTSAAGLQFIIDREALKTTAYKDSVGIWTIGVGHTASAGPPKPRQGMVITEAEARSIFARDLVQYEQAVSAACGPALNQNQFDAMTSLCFNIGQGAFKKSTLVRKWNAGDVQGAADAFLGWNKAKGRVLKGLTIRRGLERALFLKPVKSLQKPAKAVSEPEASTVPAKPKKPGAGAAAGTGGAIVAGGAVARAAGFDWTAILAVSAGLAVAALIIFVIIQKRKSL